MIEKCKVCKGPAKYSESQVFGETYHCESCNKELCPRCGAHIRAKGWNEGGGIECAAKCGYWFCY